MFRTTVDIKKSESEISYFNEIITFGSCFSEYIGKKLQNTYFSVDINPFGVLFNPESVKNSIQILFQNRLFEEKDIFNSGKQWGSFSHSTLFSALNKEECLKKINERISIANEKLKIADYIIITFGTVWVYENVVSGKIVSNCHKLPANQFRRRKLSVDEIVESYNEIIGQLLTINSDMKIIFTVSPIRHWKDGAHENNISKSTLLLAIDKIQSNFKNVSYFPAYEIQMDELRDYRFYAADMFHPSEVAVDYIWQRFSETYFSNKTIQLKKRLEQYRTQLSHRPIQPESDEYLKFKKKTEDQKLRLIYEYPFLKDRL